MDPGRAQPQCRIDAKIKKAIKIIVLHLRSIPGTTWLGVDATPAEAPTLICPQNPI
ncbi:hypothetical protein CCP4SC76_7460001 [Gammaproteobacteria bacterium]